jgi:hypothetical protein
MGFLARLFGAVPRDERKGIQLTDSDPWRVSPTKDVESFLRALPTLVPDGAVVYFEDTAEPHVGRYLQRVSVPPVSHVAVGTIWPRPDSYHVPMTSDSMAALSTFLEQNPAGYFCSHCHVYRDGVVLLEWYDAFMDVPMYISRTVGDDAVAQFANVIGASVSVDVGHR